MQANMPAHIHDCGMVGAARSSRRGRACAPSHVAGLLDDSHAANGKVSDRVCHAVLRNRARDTRARHTGGIQFPHLMLLRELHEAIPLRPGVPQDPARVDDPERLEKLPQAVLVHICGM